MALLISFTPNEIVKRLSSHSIEQIFGLFTINDENIAVIDGLLRYKEYNFAAHYNFKESCSRQLGLLRYSRHPPYHGTLFSLSKLAHNPDLTQLFFGLMQIPFTGNLLDFVDGKMATILMNKKLWRTLIKTVCDNQLSLLEDLNGLIQFFMYADEHDRNWLLHQLVPEEIFPALMGLFLKHHGRGNLGYISHFSNPVTFLQDHYFTDKNSSLDDLFLLTLNLELTILSIPDYPFLLKNIITIQVIPSSFTSWYQLLSVDEKISKLKSMSVGGRKDRAFWSTYGSLLYAICAAGQGILVCPKYLKDYFKSAPLWKVSPLVIRPLVACLEAFSRLEWDNLKLSIPTFALPLLMLPLEERRRLWLKDGPLSAIAEPIKYLDGLIDENQIVELLLRMIIDDRILPVNFMLQYDGNFIVSAIDTLLNRVGEWLKTRLFLLLGDGCKLVLCAWAHLIVLKRKMNFSRYFSSQAHPNWDTFIMKASMNMSDFLPSIKALMEILQLGVYFTISDIRTLVDSSYNGNTSK